MKIDAGAVPVWLLLLCHVTGLGCLAASLIRYRAAAAWISAILYTNAGVALLGFEMFLLGHLRGLHPAVLITLSALWAFCAFLHRDALLRAAGSLKALFAQGTPGLALARLSCGLMLAVVFVSGLRPPWVQDEVEYHWAAPLMWASAGRWVATPYRLTNGPALAEYVYTFCATLHNAIAGHWTHTLLMITLTGSVAALAWACGGSRTAAAAFCLSSPVILVQSSIMFNDVFSASLAVSAYAVLFCERRDGAFPSQRAALLTGLLLAGAVSTKPIIAASLSGVLAYLIFGGAAVPFRIRLPRLLAVTLPPVLLISLFLLHTHALLGKYWDSNGQHIARSVNDPMWQGGAAAGRIPSVKDLLLLPTVPLTAPIIGQREPYGWRTGLLLAFAPFGFWYLRRLPAPQRHAALWLTASGALFFFLLGPIAIKTRFHIMVWAFLGVIGSIGYRFLSRSENPLLRQAALAALYLLMWVGMADAARILLARH